jgi:hypothetical protein
MRQPWSADAQQADMKTFYLPLLFALLLTPFTATQAVEFDPQLADRDVGTLADRKIITAPDYWRENLVRGGKCDGAKTGTLLVELACSFKPVTEVPDAISVLAEHSIIGSPDYWTKNAVAGRQCDAGNVAALLRHVSDRLPIEAPKSAGAAPLEAVDASTIRASYDIVIAGAGTGGCGAATQAARMGRTVLLLEETDWIGGQMTAAGVTSMDEGSPLVRERGLYRELCGLIAAHYQPLGINSQTAYWHGSPCVEPHVGRMLLLKMLGDARGPGVLDLALRSRVTKVLKDGDTVIGVEVESITDHGKEARRVASKVLVDATEWGDVIPLAGARYRSGNSTSDTIDLTKHVQDLTWTAVVKQYPHGVPAELRVDTPPPGYDSFVKRFEKTLVTGSPDDFGPPAKGAPWGWNWFIGYRGMPDSGRPPNGRVITRTHLNYNNDYPVTVADLQEPGTRLTTCRAAIVKTLCLLHYIQTALGKDDWSVADDEGYDTPFNREQMDAMIAAQPELQRYRAILYQFPVMAYARESRRIVGLHTLTAREIDRDPGKPVQFPHSIALGDYPVDLHGSMTPQYLELDLDRADDIPAKFGAHGKGPFSIPFECFIPEKIDGFLAAEKNISQSRMASGATRLQPSTLNMGQAIGVIAALAVQNNTPPRAVAPLQVQRTLLDAGATLSIEPVKASWGSAQWKEQQLRMLPATGPSK